MKIYNIILMTYLIIILKNIIIKLNNKQVLKKYFPRRF